jgi:hypothetical protein
LKPYVLIDSLRLDVSNGQTLCVSCHRAIHRGKGNKPRRPNVDKLQAQAA